MNKNIKISIKQTYISTIRLGWSQVQEVRDMNNLRHSVSDQLPKLSDESPLLPQSEKTDFSLFL